jgi:hypothetical protein
MFVNVHVVSRHDYRWNNPDAEPQVITINTDHIVAIYEGLLVMSVKFGGWYERDPLLKWRNKQSFIPLWNGEWIRLIKLLEANK